MGRKAAIEKFHSKLKKLVNSLKAGENGLGIYATVLAWVYPLSLITEFGLGTLITRDVAQDPDQAHAYILATVRLRGLIGGGLLALVLIFAPQFSDNATHCRPAIGDSAFI